MKWILVKFRRILYRIRCRLRSSMPESPQEKDSRKKIQERVRALSPLTSSDESDLWTAHRNQLRSDLLNSDPRTFLTWPYILYTMFCESKKNEYEELVQKPYWKDWKNAVTETWIGYPPPYAYLPVSSGNLIHNAHSAAQLKDFSGVDFSSLEMIVEFGGGYGSMARFMFNIGFRGTYIIFDLPEFLILQEYFLTLVGMVDNVVFIDTPEKLAAALGSKKVDLLIATWSLSESPIHLRDVILNIVKKPQYFLVGYQESFDGMDNESYFEKLVSQRQEYLWKTFPIIHLPRNHYLIGERKMWLFQ